MRTSRFSWCAIATLSDCRFEPCVARARPQRCLPIDNGRLARTPVATGIDDGRYVEITAGLKSDQLVVSTYSNSLRDGEAVDYRIAGADSNGGDSESASTD